MAPAARGRSTSSAAHFKEGRHARRESRRACRAARRRRARLARLKDPATLGSGKESEALDAKAASARTADGMQRRDLCPPHCGPTWAGAFRKKAAWYARLAGRRERFGRARDGSHHLTPTCRSTIPQARRPSSAGGHAKGRIGDRRQQAWLLAHMGDAHAARGDLGAALDHHQRATALWEAIGDPRGMATGLENVARVEFALRHYDTSIATLRRAADLLAKTQPAFVPGVLAEIGRAYAAAGDPVRALEHGRTAVTDARQSSVDEVRWRTLRALGWIERRLGLQEDALRSYLASLDVVDTLRGRLAGSAEARADFSKGSSRVCETVDLLMERGHAERALEVAERARARAFADLFSGHQAGSRAPHLARLTIAEARSEARRRGTTFVEYFSAPERLFIWVLAPDGSLQGTSSRVSRAELSALVGSMRQSMSGGAAVTRAPLARLHAALVDPIASFLPPDPDRLITIVPHGPLSLVSFAALVDGQGHYFVERHAVAYTPSIAVLRVGDGRRSRSANTKPAVLVVGNPSRTDAPDDSVAFPPLPGAEREARAIAALYPQADVDALVGSPRARAGRSRACGPLHNPASRHACRRLRRRADGRLPGDGAGRRPSRRGSRQLG